MNLYWVWEIPFIVYSWQSIIYFRLDRERNEEYLMKKLLSKKNSFDAIEKKITPTALTKCVSNSLLMGMKVSNMYKSHTRTAVSQL